MSGRHKRERDWNGYTGQSLLWGVAIVGSLTFVYVEFGHMYLN